MTDNKLKATSSFLQGFMDRHSPDEPDKETLDYVLNVAEEYDLFIYYPWQDEEDSYTLH